MVNITEHEAAILLKLALIQTYRPDDVDQKKKLLKLLKGDALKVGRAITGVARGLDGVYTEIANQFLQWAKRQNGKAS